jgi:hypothetical protein
MENSNAGGMMLKRVSRLRVGSAAVRSRGNLRCALREWRKEEERRGAGSEVEGSMTMDA